MMTTEPIHESGMTFGPFPEGHCFYIEKSRILHDLQPGIQMAEFLLLHTEAPPVIWIVEAKSSSPRPSTQPEFDQFIDDIRSKLLNAFSLGMAACLKRHQLTENELSAKIMNVDLEKVDFRFILVIRGHQVQWLAPLKDALAKAFQATLKTWALLPAKSVVVLNGELARQYSLIQ